MERRRFFPLGPCWGLAGRSSSALCPTADCHAVSSSSRPSLVFMGKPRAARPRSRSRSRCVAGRRRSRSRRFVPLMHRTATHGAPGSRRHIPRFRLCMRQRSRKPMSISSASSSFGQRRSRSHERSSRSRHRVRFPSSWSMLPIETIFVPHRYPPNERPRDRPTTPERSSFGSSRSLPKRAARPRSCSRARSLPGPSPGPSRCESRSSVDPMRCRFA